jgi:hypothetical protein
MDKEKIKEIINNFKESNNKDLVSALDFLSKEHELVKNTIVKLTYYFDEVENSYGKILEEFKTRNKK